jgi:transglutaminase-like putative cysteine protease
MHPWCEGDRESGDGHGGNPHGRDTHGGNTHAWAQVYLPGPGWVDFDPSSGIVGNRDLV